MALVQRYINTASTPGGDGTTNATTGTNRAYASMTEWEAAEQTDLVTAGDVHKVTCSGGEDVGEVVISGWTGNTTSYLIIEVDDASYHGMQLGAGYRITADGAFLTAFDLSNVDATIIDGLSVERTGASGSSGNGMEIFSSPNSILLNCIVRNDTDSDDYAEAAIWNRGNAADGADYINCLVLNSGTGFASSAFTEGRFYLCDAIDCVAGFRGKDSSAREPVAIGCFTFGCTTSWTQTWSNTASSHNATDDATVPANMAGADGGTNEATLVTGVVSGDLEDYANDDFRLASGSALIDVGTDLESVFNALSRADYTVAIKDAFGNSRPQGSEWDIGMHEFVSGGGTNHTQDLSATLSLSATLARDAGKTQSANVSLTDAIGNSTSKVLSASLSLVDTIARTTTRSFSELVGLTAAVQREIIRSFVETVTVAATVATLRSYTEALAASVGLTAAVSKTTGRILSAATSLADTVTTALVSTIILTASLTVTDAITTSISKALTAGVMLTAIVSRSMTRTLTVSLLLTAAVANRTARAFNEAISLAASVTTTTVLAKALSATVTLAASASHVAGKALSASITLVDGLVRTLARSFSEVITVAAALSSTLSRTLSASVSLTASIARVVSLSFNESITATASLAKRFSRSFSEALSLTAVVEATTDLVEKIVRAGHPATVLLTVQRGIRLLSTKKDKTTLTTKNKDKTVL